MEADIFEDLPVEVIYMILLELSARDLLNFCETKTGYKRFCDSETIWKILYEKDFPHRDPIEKTYRESYKSAQRIPFFDNWSVNTEGEGYYIRVRFPTTPEIGTALEELMKNQSLPGHRERSAAFDKFALSRLPYGDKWKGIPGADKNNIEVRSYLLKRVDGKKRLVTDINGFQFQLGKPNYFSYNFGGTKKFMHAYFFDFTGYILEV